MADSAKDATRVITRGPEFTNVSMVTEVKIPFRTWLLCALVSAVDVLAVVCALILFSRQLWNWRHPPRIYGASWWPSTARALWVWWPSVLILMLAGVVAWSVPLLYRFLVETIVKQTPQYTPYPSEYGRWRPFVRGAPAQDDEYEAEAKPVETVDVNLWDKITAHKRPRRRTLPDFLITEQARMYYRAVAAGKAFSEREAQRYGIGQSEFRKHVRDALLRRGLATWKNEQHKNLGVDLSEDAMKTLELLGRKPPPRQSA